LVKSLRSSEVCKRNHYVKRREYQTCQQIRQKEGEKERSLSKGGRRERSFKGERFKQLIGRNGGVKVTEKGEKRKVEHLGRQEGGREIRLSWRLGGGRKKKWS